jgi:hypothetical protein
MIDHPAQIWELAFVKKSLTLHGFHHSKRLLRLILENSLYENE